jgi:hypothetical protein
VDGRRDLLRCPAGCAGERGSIVAALCCIGILALLAFVASIGAGFLIRDVMLVSLLVVFLVVTIWGKMRARDVHGQRGPLLVTVTSSIAIVAAVGFSRLLVLLGVDGLIGSAVWNLVLHQACPQTARENA